MNSIVTNQIQVFLSFILVGIILSFIFDIFRILRKSYKFQDFMIYMQDILFWLLVGIITLYSIFKLNSGEIRGYLFFSIFLGVFLYSCFISKYIIAIGLFITKILNHIFNIIITSLGFFYKIICKISRKVIYIIMSAGKKSHKVGLCKKM